jgi:hypothetical protein
MTSGCTETRSSEPGVHPHRRSHRATYDGTTGAEDTGGVGTNIVYESRSTVGTLLTRALGVAAVNVHGIQQEGGSRTHCRLSEFSDMSHAKAYVNSRSHAPIRSDVSFKQYEEEGCVHCNLGS